MPLFLAITFVTLPIAAQVENSLGFETQVPLIEVEELIEDSPRADSFYVDIAFDGTVSITNETTVSLYSNPPTATCGSVEYDGTYRGEWGGRLRATYPDGREAVLIQENIHALYVRWNVLYVFGGLHGRGGSLYRVGNCDEPGSPIELVSLLPNPVIDYEIVDRIDMIEIHAITKDALWEIFPGRMGSRGKIGMLLHHPWQGLEPTTSAKMDEFVYAVGLWGGLAVVDLTKQEDVVKYYVSEVR